MLRQSLQILQDLFPAQLPTRLDWPLAWLTNPHHTVAAMFWQDPGRFVCGCLSEGSGLSTLMCSGFEPHD